ncbi:MAG: hypothetical protein A3C53_05475 [Omnitrophica WOR_2 bacterium RIFCSPHIGHO2_02_FULL_68_15]|nr:MAG: hypothetical protein A3C53_05475 [Omnitrophica WOR_2 bacterium RIFCSPHIGHO2_02_FULL_68_15]
MRVVDRYLITGFLLPFLYCLALFLVLFVVVNAFSNLSDFLRHAKTIPFGIIAAYYLHLVPTMLTQVVPIAALVAILYTLGILGKHNEIIALKASGVSVFSILSPYLFMGMLISFAVMFVNETIVPQSALTSTAIMEGVIQRGRERLSERAIKNATLYGKDNRLFFAREFEVVSGTLWDVSVIEDDAEQFLRAKLTAKKARYENGRWTFYDAMRYKLNRRGDLVGEPEFFPAYDPGYPDRPEDFVKSAQQIEFMNSKQLKAYIDRLRGSGEKLSRRLWVDFHSKNAVPFITFIVMLIGAPLALSTARHHAMLGIGTSFIIVLLYYSIDSICLALGKGGYLPPLLSAWLSNLLFGAVGVYLIRTSS